jgi:hypothetical protein
MERMSPSSAGQLINYDRGEASGMEFGVVSTCSCAHLSLPVYAGPNL